MTKTNEIQNFVNKFIIPNKEQDVDSDNIWALTDINNKYWAASNKFAKLFGYNNGQALVGKNLESLNVLHKNDLAFIRQQESQVLKTRRSTRGILFVDFSEVMHIFALTINPIFYEKELIGFEKKFTPISRNNFNLHKIEHGSHSTRKTILQAKTKQEEYLLYLLILNKNQQEIAKHLGVSRSRVVQIITKLSGQLGVSGCATKLLIDQAIANGYHKLIPVELFMLIA